MIVDTSAFMAIVLDEPEKSAFRDIVLGASSPRISAGTSIEIQAVLTRRWRGTLDERADALIQFLRLTTVPVNTEQAQIARAAYRTYGIGTGHPARLNFGDCFAYALAKATGEPLLYKGDDFAATDVVAALPRGS